MNTGVAVSDSYISEFIINVEGTYAQINVEFFRKTFAGLLIIIGYPLLSMSGLNRPNINKALLFIFL